MWTLCVLGLTSLVALAGGCDGEPRARAPRAEASSSRAPLPATVDARPASAPEVASVAVPPPPEESTELTSPTELIALAVPGFDDAVVALPLGSRGARPVVVAAHGNYDRPEWQCSVWKSAFAEQAFVLCPRGEKRPDSPSKDDVRFTYATNASLERETLAGLAALRARFGPRVDAGPIVWAGFSLGAIQGVAVATRNPKTIQRLVLVEGGHDKWTQEAVKAFQIGGGARVLFVCSSPWCASDANAAAQKLERAHVANKVVRSENVGHRYDGPVAVTAKKALPWLLEGDPRFTFD